MGSDDIHEILSTKSYEIQWDLMGFMGFYDLNLMKRNGIWWYSWNFNYQILWNPMGSDGIHGVLGLKPCEIQWDLMGFMGF